MAFHHSTSTGKDKLGNDLLHDLGCPATDGQHPVIAKQSFHRVPAHESVIVQPLWLKDTMMLRQFIIAYKKKKRHLVFFGNEFLPFFRKQTRPGFDSLGCIQNHTLAMAPAHNFMLEL